MNLFRPIILSLVFLAAILPAGAAKPAFWTIDSAEDFEDGTLKGLSITRDGRLVLAPAFEELADTGQPYILSAAADGSGNVYVGTGHDGKVFRLDQAGRLTTWFDAEEADVFALAAGADGAVYAAAGPGGRIYRIGPDGRGALLVDLACRYVWSLAIDAKDTLYAGTGPEGKIFKILDEKAEEFYDSPQTHVMSLLLEPAGSLLAGTAPNGYVIRLAADGRGESIFDADQAEIRQLALDRYGVVYVLALGKEAEPAKASAADLTADATIAVFEKSEPRKKNRAVADSTAVMVSADLGKSEVGALYKLGPGNRVSQLWGSGEIKAFALAIQPDGELLLGSGDRGRILSVGESRLVTTLVESGQEQVTVLLPRPDGIVAGGSNQGKLYRLGPQTVTRGEYLSDVGDAERAARFGIVEADLSPASAGVVTEFFFRSGNTARPDATWTDWQGPVNAASGWLSSSKVARYFQVRVTVSLAAGQEERGTGFYLERLRLSCQQINQAPRLTALEVNPPGVTFQKQPVIMQPGDLPEYGDRSSLEMPPDLRQGLVQMVGVMQMPKMYRPGYLSMTWKSEDPNGDLLEYGVFVRPRGGETWTRLAAGLRQTAFELGRDSLADGRYQFKVVVSDAPSNLPAEAREDFLVSRVVTLDSEPPRLSVLSQRRQGERWQVAIEAADDWSPVYQAEYSSDGGQSWQAMFPEDGLCDQTRESFRLDLPGLDPVIGQWLVRVMDATGTLAALTVPPARK